MNNLTCFITYWLKMGTIEAQKLKWAFVRTGAGFIIPVRTKAQKYQDWASSREDFEGV